MKVGEYVRTKSGGIGKIIEIDNNAGCSHIITDNENFGLGWDGEQVNWDFITEIVKSSPNIIDLIEVGDYVNGKKVVNKQYHYTDEDNYDMGEWCIFYENIALGDYQYDIKSIVTKEAFETMEYKCE